MKHRVQKAGSVVLDIKRYFNKVLKILIRYFNKIVKYFSTYRQGLMKGIFFFFAHPDVENGQWNNKQRANE